MNVFVEKYVLILGFLAYLEVKVLGNVLILNVCVINSDNQWSRQPNNAPINVKPGGGGGGGGQATHGNLTVACIPRVGILIGHHAFHLSVFIE